MRSRSLGEKLLLMGWSISKVVGETHLIIARNDQRALYDCDTDQIIGRTIRVTEEWNMQQEHEQIDPEKIGGLKTIIAEFKPVGTKSLAEIFD